MDMDKNRIEENVIENCGVLITEHAVEINEQQRKHIGVDCCPYGPTTQPIELQGKTIEEQIHHFAVICKQIDMCKSNVN